MTKDQALRQALEALEQLDGIDTETECVTIDVGDVITAIKQALEQPEPEILGWATHHDEPMLFPTRKEAVLYCEDDEEPRPLYTSPPKREPEPEPVAFYVYKPNLPRGHLGNVSDGDLPWVYDQDPSSGYTARMLVYTSPPKREWRWLTDDEICPWFQENTALTNEAAMRITRAIEAKLKEKNT